MARNKDSEKTVDKILEVSLNLFIDKGYDKASIQDIINELGLSKGAIYHHFKSKEEILYAVLKREQENTRIYLDEIILNTQGCSAREKLKLVLKKLITNEELNNANKFFINQSNNSKIILENIIQTVNESALRFYPLIKEGIEDGSIETSYPKECSELLLLLCNVWLNPILFSRTYDEIINRINFIQFTMKQLGVDVIDDEIISSIEKNLKGVLY